MSTILVADLQQGSDRLVTLLATRHKLILAKTVDDVLRTAELEKLDLIIVGILFDESRMYEVVSAIKHLPQLEKLPVMGFSDQHTSLSVSGRNIYENAMHMVGACDYVDTMNMSDKEIVDRIESCLQDQKGIGRKVLKSDESPSAKRRQQENTRNE